MAGLGRSTGLGFHGNTHILYHHGAKYNPKPQQPTDFTKAFERDTLTKIRRELSGQDHILKCKALRLLLKEQFISPATVVWSLEFDMLAGLFEVLHGRDTEAKALAAEALSVLVRVPNARQAFLEGQFVAELAEVLSDENLTVRLEIYSLLETLCQSRDGLEHVATAANVNVLIAKAKGATKEPNDPQAQAGALSVLSRILQFRSWVSMRSVSPTEGEQGPASGLKLVCESPESGMAALCSLVTHHDSRVRHKAAACVSEAAKQKQGRRAAILEDVVPRLVALLGDGASADDSVLLSASSALMSLLIELDAKHQATDAMLHQPLIQLMSSSHAGIVLNCLKVMTVLAEHPVGRKNLRDSGAVAPIYQMLDRFLDDDLLQKSAQIAIKQIHWVP